MGFFNTQDKRANQVSLFDTNLKQQKFAFLKGFFPLMREKNHVVLINPGVLLKDNIP